MLANDVPGTPTFAIATNGSNGNVTMDAEGNWTYVPTANFHGTDTFTLRVSSTVNGQAFTDDETVTITVNSVDDGHAVKIADGALSTDGDNHYVSVPHGTGTALDGDFTVEAWVNSTGTGTLGAGTGGPIIAKEGQFAFGRFADGSINVAIAGQPANTFQWVDTGYDLPLNTWTHLALTYDESARTVMLYADGNLVSSITHTGAGELIPHTVTPTTNPVTIGGRPDISDIFKGQIDEVRIWDDIRTAQEIRTNYDQQLAGSETNLQAYYRFDDDTDGNVVTNQATATGSALDGTLTNGADITASGATVLGNEIEIQSSEIATGTMTAADVVASAATFTITDAGAVTNAGSTTFTTTHGGAVTINNSTGVWSYDPADGYYGSDTFTVRAASTTGGVTLTDDETVTVTIKSDNNVETNNCVLQVDGNDDAVTVADNAALDLTGDMTIEAWINPTGASSNGTLGLIAGKENSYLLSRFDDDSIRFALNGPGGTWNWTDTGYDVPADTWTHLSMTYDASERAVMLYANGELVSTSTNGFIPTSLTTGTGAFMIGGRTALNEEFKGLIDDVRVWNDLRTADEIRENYDQKLSGSESGLAGYWNFDDVSGTTVQDGTANNNDGTISDNAKVVPNLGDALDFDGSNTYINAGRGTSNSLAIAGDLTVETWARFDAISGTQAIVDFALNDTGGETQAGNVLYQLALRSDGDLEYAHEYGNGDNSTALVFDTNLIAGQWYHIAMVRDVSAKLVKILVDGVVVGTAAYTTNGPEGGDNATLIIGANGAGATLGTNKLNGQMSDLRIWNVARSDEQIADNRDSVINGNQNGSLVLNYLFDEGSGSTVTDHSGTQSTAATVTGTAAWVDTAPDINGTTLSIGENQSAQGTMNAAGADGSATYAASASNGGTVSINAEGNWTYRPAENYHGTETITFTATGVQGTVDTETVTVTIGDTAHVSPVSNGGVLVLDGSDDYVDLGTSSSMFTGTGDFTYEAWVKPAAKGSRGEFISIGSPSAGAAVYMFIDEGGRLEFDIHGEGGPESPVVLTEGAWHHVAATFDASTKVLSLYVDGSLEVTQVMTSNINIASGNAYIGSSDNSLTYQGQIDDVRIWGDVRTATEIRDNYNQTAPADADNLVGNWIFDGTIGNTVADHTSNGNDGTLTNGASIGGSGPDIHTNSVTIIEDQTASGTMTSNDVVPGSATFGVSASSSVTGATSLTIDGKGTVTIDANSGAWTFTPTAGYVGKADFYLTVSGGGISDAEQFTVDVNPDHDPNVAGASVQFDGSTTALTAAHDAALNPSSNGFTFETWIQVDTASAWAGIGQKYSATANGWKVSLDGSGQHVNFWLGNGSAQTVVANTTNVNDGAWHHVAAVYDTSAPNNPTIQLYIDGVAAGGSALTVSSAYSVANLANTANVLLGWDDYASNRHLDGRLDDVRIWSDVRTAEEIADSYNSQMNGNESNLQAYWTFNDADDGTVVDQTGHGHYLTTPSGSTAPDIIGPHGKALTFDGIDDVANLGNNLSADDSKGTYVVWMKTNGQWNADGETSPDYATLIARHGGDGTPGSLNGLHISVAPNGDLKVEIKDNSGTVATFTASGGVTDNQWHQIAFSYDQASGSQQNLYVDGVLIASATVSGAWTFSTNELRIGSSPDPYWEQFAGAIAEVSVYDRQLSLDEVADGYHNGLPATDSNLVAHLTFDELNGSTVVDESGNGHDGTVYGNATTLIDTTPEIGGNSLTVVKGGSVSGFMSGGDVTGTATYTVASAPTHGTLSIDATSGEYVYTPNGGYSGGDSFTLRATGVTSGVDDEIISVTVASGEHSSVTQTALQLDGVDDYVDLGPLSENISGAYAFEAWVHYDPTAFDDNNWMRVLELGNGPSSNNLLLAIEPGSDLISFDTYNGASGSSLKTSFTPPTGEWLHIAAVNDGTNTSYLYVNGDLVASGTTLTAANLARTVNYIGQSNWPNESNMSGAVTDVRIWNTFRTAAEIKANYDQHLVGNESGLVAYYTFDDTSSGVVQDKTSHGNDGQIITNGTDGAGPTGNVLDLSGAGSVQITDTDNSTDFTAGSAMTMEMWYRPDAISGEDSLLNKHVVGGGVNYKLYVLDGKVGIYSDAGANGTLVTDSAVVTANAWQHIAVSYDGTNATIYVDGVAVKTGLWTLGTVTDGNMRIGSSVDSGGDMAAQVDDVRIWNTARSADEIRDGMAQSYDYDTSGLVAQYTFDNVNGTAVHDDAYTSASGTTRTGSQNGTLTGDAKIVDGGSGGGTALAFLDKAIHFDGTDDVVTTTLTGPSGTGAKTVMLWAKTSSDTPQRFVTWGDGGTVGGLVSLGINGVDGNDRGITLDVAGMVTYKPVTEPDDGQWHHYTVVIPGGASLSDARVYQDGVLLTTEIARFSNLNPAINTGAGALTIGNTSYDTNGDLAEVSVWNTALSTAQVQQYMTQQLSGTETGLVGYWRGDLDGDGKFKDYSSGNHDGTLSGDATIIDVAPDIHTTSLTITENTIATGRMSGDDVVGTPNYAVQAAAANGTVTVDAATGVWNYVPNAGYDGTDTFTLRAAGSNGSTDDEVVSIHVGQDPVLPTNFAIELDGADDYVDLGTFSGNLSGAFSAEAWINLGAFETPGKNGWMRIFDVGDGTGGGNANGFLLTATAKTGELALYTYNNGVTNVTASSPLPLNEWTHVAAVNDGAGNAYLYINGVLAASASGQKSGSSADLTSAYIGRSNASPDSYLDGQIADARIWSDARTATEISDNYDRQLIGNEQGLIGYWTFNEGSGSIANDKSGNGNDAAIVGGTHENLTEISLASGASYKGLILGADADGDSLSYSLDSGPRSSSNFALDADGSFSYTHDSGADDSFSVVITDTDGHQTTETIHIEAA